MAFFSIAFHFIGNLDIWAVDIISDDGSSDDSANYFACVDSDPHIKACVVDFFPYVSDDFDHAESEVDDVFSFLNGLGD